MIRKPLRGTVAPKLTIALPKSVFDTRLRHPYALLYRVLTGSLG